MKIFGSILVLLCTVPFMTITGRANAQSPASFLTKKQQPQIEPFVDGTGELFDTGSRFINADRILGPEEIPIISRQAIPFHVMPREWGSYALDTPLPLRRFLRPGHIVPSLLPEEGNWDEVLPDIIEAPENRPIPTVVARDDTWTYLDTPHFRIAYDTKSITNTRAIENTFFDMETAYILGRIFPLHFPGAQNNLCPEKYTFYIYGNQEEFEKKTGAKVPGININGICYINGELFGLSSTKSSSHSNNRHSGLYSICVHEWIHTIEPASILTNTPFTEGFAMYLDQLGILETGNIDLTNFTEKMIQKIASAAKAAKSHGEQSELESPYRFPEGFQKIMTAPEAIYNNDEKCICLNRTRALLITAYFMHMDRNRDGKNLKDFLRMRQEGVPKETCIERLKDGRSWEQLFTDFSAAWQKYNADVSTL